MHQVGLMVRVRNMSWETHCIRHQSLLHFPRSPVQIWSTWRRIVCMNLPEHFRGSERGMRPSEAVQSWVSRSSRHFTGRRASDIQSQANMWQAHPSVLSI
ncbi:hypothetical protein ARMGADRAFT_13783 [Armillaria gallica]|uniref:Uncharacterized protein n=1 Tax=Armillaria gallica TaxID=47427 RepID=A0A2H3EJ86_ARMGA|nr:hypothetical protein ARMGADRAFT_13783 [Armillaria gallica]